jgi:hypothetical protein
MSPDEPGVTEASRAWLSMLAMARAHRDSLPPAGSRAIAIAADDRAVAACLLLVVCAGVTVSSSR